MIAALYVLPSGPYSRLGSVELWDKARDARRYAGPWPVVAHPPCERWGAYWSGGPKHRGKELGDDGGCFAAALAAVRRWVGILEHPATTQAWKAFGLASPPRDGGWMRADAEGGFTCCVEQGHYGHRARKATWLYAAHVALPELVWGASARTIVLPEVLRRPPKDLSVELRRHRRVELRRHRRVELRRHRRVELRRLSQETGKVWACPEMMNKREREETPPAFRDLLVSIARSCRLVNRAEAYCWVARLLSLEADQHFYRYPRTEEDFAAGDELQRGSDAFYAAADALIAKPAQLALPLDDDDGGARELIHDVWRRSLDKWDGEVK